MAFPLPLPFVAVPRRLRVADLRCIGAPVPRPRRKPREYASAHAASVLGEIAGCGI
jgi:hypothetical protein